MGGGAAPPTLRRDHRLDAVEGNLLADGIGIITPIGQQRLHPVGEPAEQRCEAVDVVRLAGRQDKTERATLAVAARVEFGGEAAA